jgi:hypothetical protein
MNGTSIYVGCNTIYLELSSTNDLTNNTNVGTPQANLVHASYMLNPRFAVVNIQQPSECGILIVRESKLLYYYGRTLTKGSSLVITTAVYPRPSLTSLPEIESQTEPEPEPEYKPEEKLLLSKARIIEEEIEKQCEDILVKTPPTKPKCVCGVKPSHKLPLKSIPK